LDADAAGLFADEDAGAFLGAGLDANAAGFLED
jgi:hypothetical protein